MSKEIELNVMKGTPSSENEQGLVWIAKEEFSVSY